MGRPPKEKQQENTEENVNTDPSKQLEKFLNLNKEDHLNFEPEQNYKIGPSSLSLRAVMGGGMGPGSSRFIGVPSGGKSSQALDFLRIFLTNKNHRGVYIKAEGRLSPEMRARSGITFTDNFAEWKDGNCFIFNTNVYEATFSLIKDLITNNPTGTKYFFIVDSINMLGKREDLAKPFEDANQVAGGALLTSDFFRKTSNAMNHRGHICIFISQVREAISLTPYSAAPTRQGKSSGAHSLEHQGEWVLDFLPRFNDDIIRENPADKNSKPIGHYCKVNIIKSPNEKYNFKIQYPVKYGRSAGNSVWIEREIVDMLLGWGQIEKKGAWFNFTQNYIDDAKKDIDVDISAKIQGLESVYNLIENNEVLKDYLYKKVESMIVSQ